MDQSIGSILVPTDGSDGSEPGERRGVDLAATVGADLHVVSVVDTRELSPSLSQLDADPKTKQKQLLEEKAETAVDDVAQLARNHLSGRITTAVERGIPFRSITDYVETNDIDMIVMGTHGRTGLERVLLGSVAEKTLRTASVPVVLVPPSEDVVEVGDIEYENLLLPTDGSEGAEFAIDWGLYLAREYDAAVHTVYSVDTGRFVGGTEMADIHDALERAGQAALETVRERARDAGVSANASLGTGPAARMIRSYSQEHDIDLIVMGTHGRSGIERYLIGSVTEAVVRHSDLPVCCVPMTER